jgi:hypothetical protein
MFRNLAIAIVSVCTVSTGSPAWSQNPQDQPGPPPSDGQQFAQSDLQSHFDKLREKCQDRLTQNKVDKQFYCTGEEARLLFKILKEFKADTTETVVDGTRWFQRVQERNTRCWAREESDGKDFIVSMSYACKLLGSAQACSVQFETGRNLASPVQFALLWPELDQINGRFFLLGGEASTPVQENIPPNAKYCSKWPDNEPLWSWDSKCAQPIWPDGKCSGGVKVITFP